MENNLSPTKQEMEAIFTTPNTFPGLAIRKTVIPIPSPNQALIKVKTFTLNQGETRTALATTKSYIPGWDFAGVVVKAAEDGSTPKAGARVFGYIAQGSWAEYLVAPGGLMAEIPEALTDAQAACLPIAGLTALDCLDASGNIRNLRVLITGAAGGVGRFACQLAAMAGAKVFAISRRAGLAHQLEIDGINTSCVFKDIEEAKNAGEYDIIWDSLGGDVLATALTTLTRNGICVNFGNSARQATSINVRSAEWPLHRVQCIWLGREPMYPSTPLLDRLAAMVKTGSLQTPIDSEQPWTSISKAVDKLIQQQVDGKIVLYVENSGRRKDFESSIL
ncbi:zinc-binding dehydrogenase [Chitinophaga sp. HK235]|uniref:zinc-binding dehydrogenase n=1 Tax=Chitinophaga sp. HK235 TaxID=2952571 RepID=UPI001BAA9E9E|nr:zinc-binding dehydrogenase [Chitinophaga sp. HK235]